MTITTSSADLPADGQRKTACRLVVNGLESIREGLLLYQELGLTTKEIYADLKAAGWTKSLRTLERHRTELRKEGLLPESTMARQPIAAKSGDKSVEKPPEKFSPVIQPDVVHEVNPDEVKAFNDMTDVVEELLNENAALRAELNELKNTLTNDNDPVHQHTSRLATYGTGEGSELDESTAPPIDFDWHPGVQMDSEERRDCNRIGELFNEIGSIQRKYAFTGRLGPTEWCSIFGGLKRLAACADAQRRYRPGSESTAVIDVGRAD